MFLEAFGLAVVCLCLGALHLLLRLLECLSSFFCVGLGLGQVGLCLFGFCCCLGQAGVGVLELCGGLVDGALEVGVFLAKAGEVAFQLGQLLGLLRRRHGRKGFLEFGILDDDRVFERLNLSLENGDLSTCGGGVKGSRFVQGCLYILRSFGSDFLELLVQVLDAKTHNRCVPIRIARLQGGQVIPSLLVFLDGGVFLPESG